jgi:hypothetical protein
MINFTTLRGNDRNGYISYPTTKDNGSTRDSNDHYQDSKFLAKIDNINSKNTSHSEGLNSKVTVLSKKIEKSIQSPPRISTCESSINKIPRPSLFDLIDEDFVIGNMLKMFQRSRRNVAVGSKRESLGRNTILDEIDGLTKENEDSFMTSRAYPRGVRVLNRKKNIQKGRTGHIELVIAQEAFEYWIEDILEVEPCDSLINNGKKYR